jgi:DNA polymerase-3 subunit epsilon
MTKRPSEQEPPSGSPWDDPLGEAALLFVDLEMTGLRPEVDRVLELCAERVQGGRLVDRISTLIRPEPPVHGNEHIHGISRDDVATAPGFSEVVEDVERLLDGAIVVAHGAPWDIAFLEAEFARAGRTRTVPFYIDTLTLSRRALALPSHALSALCKELRIDTGHAHRAGDDVRALRELFQHLIEVLAPKTARDLWHVRVGSRVARPDIVAKAVRAAELGAPVTIRYRAARRPPEELSFQITSVRTDLDPPHVLGYLLVTRSRRELRADRILAIEPSSPLSFKPSPR